MKSKDVFAVVETLYVMARGGILGTPGNIYIYVCKHVNLLDPDINI